jgi:hypothetical protein
MINSFIAILVHKEILTKAEGEALAKKLNEATLPSDFGTALKQVEKFFRTIVNDL